MSGHFGACVNTGQFGAGLCKNCAHEEIQRLRTHNHALELGLRVAEERLAEAGALLREASMEFQHEAPLTGGNVHYKNCWMCRYEAFVAGDKP